MTSTKVSQNLDAEPVIGGLLFFREHSARIIDAVLMGLIVVRTGVPNFPIAIPAAQLALIVLLVIAVFRRPVRSLERVRWYPAVAAFLLTYLIAVSLVQDVDFMRRLINIAVLMTVTGFMASGRIDIASGIKGIAVALILNTVLFYAGIAPDYYGGALTGYLEDKNAAGLVYGTGAILFLLTIHGLWPRIFVYLLGAGAVMLADSRTAMAAYAAVGVWLLVAPHIVGALRMALGAGLAFAFFWADENLADAGDYGETRAGSDALRQRIDDAADAKLAATPWYGGGLGEATVEMESGFWYFHNSYYGLIAEGGFITLIAVVGIYLLAGFGFPLRGKTSIPSTIIGGATLFLFLTATRLGEVFFAPIGFVLLGVGMALAVERDPFTVNPRVHLAIDRQTSSPNP